MPQVIIRNPKTDESYEISTANFRHGKHYRRPGQPDQTFADAGFRIVSLADGQPYTGPLNDAPASRQG